VNTAQAVFCSHQPFRCQLINSDPLSESTPRTRLFPDEVTKLCNTAPEPNDQSHSTLGHYQDMNVLGAGPADDEPLKPGMVFAIEPILYSKEQKFAAFVEDVILVTADGYEVLSKGMPYTTDEIEKLMSHKSIIEASDERH